MVPIGDLADLVRLVDGLFGIYPLWVCSMCLFDHRLYRDMHRKNAGNDAFPEVYDKVVPENWLKKAYAKRLSGEGY